MTRTATMVSAPPVIPPQVSETIQKTQILSPELIRLEPELIRLERDAQSIKKSLKSIDGSITLIAWIFLINEILAILGGVCLLFSVIG